MKMNETSKIKILIKELKLSIEEEQNRVEHYNTKNTCAIARKYRHELYFEGKRDAFQQILDLIENKDRGLEDEY